jgi:hypothetical protein
MKLLNVLKYIFVFNKRRAIAWLGGAPRAVAAAMCCDGQTETDELICLARYAEGVSERHAIVEVGSFRGRSCVAMALSCRKNVPVFSVDPYLATKDCHGVQFEYGTKDREICQLNLILSGAIENTRNIYCCSEEAVKYWNCGLPIGLVFIDGSHELLDVQRDFESWFPYIAPNGILCFHDSTNPKWGVYKLMELLRGRGDLQFVELVNAISVFRKSPKTISIQN